MKLKRTFGIILAFVLLLGIAAPCFPVKADTEHQHTYGQWTFNTEGGYQSRICSDCGETQTFHGIINKVEQVTDPVIGGAYYLAANVDGTLQYFRSAVTGESVTSTTPYSVYVTTDLNHTNIKQITLEAPASGTEGFQLTFDDNGAVRRIYCYNASTADAAMDTGHHGAAATLSKHTFAPAQVNGVNVLRKLNNNNILVVKYNETTGAYRMLGVPESELANEGVYPAMLVTMHTHVYSNEYAFDGANHWKACDCGNQIEKAAHTAGEWVFDTENGTQSKFCTVCQATLETLHGTTTKATQVTEPVVGETYYLAANVAGQLYSFLATGGYTETSPYSLRTSTTLNQVTLDPALQAGQGEFQLVEEAGKYFYSVAAGAGTTVSSGYITNPARVSFSMDEVNGVSVIRAYGTGNILAVKYSDTKSAWRVFAVDESELANEGVYPVMLLNKHTHDYGDIYEKDESVHWQICECGTETVKVNHSYYDGVCVCGVKNTDIQRTATKKYSTNRDVAGLDRYKLSYTATDSTATAHVVTIQSDAAVEMVVSASEWSESSTAENPGDTMTVKERFKKILNSGENILAIINGGFFDRTVTKTMKPYGMQIVNGVVKQAPSTTDPNHSDNWFGVTKDGKYVISNTAGYNSTYVGKIQQGVGGGKILIENGIMKNLSSVRDARTAVGINADGDLIMLVVDNANYIEVAAIFKDIDPTVQTVLNLDGGGSSSMFRIGTTNGKVTTVYVNDTTRKVADAVAIIAK